MIIIGHKAIASVSFVKVSCINDIKHTKSGQVVHFSADLAKSYALANHCRINNIVYAVSVSDVTKLLIFANLGTSYIIVCGDKKKASAFQSVIEHYLLDCKLLYPIKTEREIADLAHLGIDGVIFKQELDRI